MKNHVKKALAGLLSVLTALGAAAPAFAASGSYGSGGMDAQVISNEGPVPSQIISVTFPTRRNGMFDFIVDPNGLIAQSDAAAYKTQYSSDVTFDEGKLFFQNLSEDSDGVSHVSYSKRSDSLVVTNRSSFPVDIAMDVEIDKGTNNFTFAATPDFKDSVGNAIDGPSMYMALVCSKRTEAILPVISEEDDSVKYAAHIAAWIDEPDDAYHITWTDGAYKRSLKEGTPESAFHSVAFYLTGAINGTWPESDAEINMSINWDIEYPTGASEYTESPFTVPDTSPAVSVREGASAVGDVVTLVVDFGSGSLAMPTLDGIAYTKSDESTTLFTPADGITLKALDEFESVVSVTATDDLLIGYDWAVQLSNAEGQTVSLPFDFLKPDDNSVEPSATVTSPVNTSGSWAVVDVDWGSGRYAMTAVKNVTYVKSNGAAATISGTNITTEENTVSVRLNATSIKGKDFVLVLQNDYGRTFEIPVELIGEPAADPTATVTTKATAAGESAVVTVDWGSGSKAMTSVTQVKYMNADGADVFITGSDITTEGNTVSIKIDETALNGSAFVLMFSNDNDESFGLLVDLVDPPEPEPTGEDPTVTVTQKVTASGQSAVMTVNWGSGDKAMTKVSKVTYTKSTGAAGSITGTNITTNGNTVSVKIALTPFKGKDFILVLANDSNKTFELPVDLIETPEVEDANPTATVTKKAAAANESATLTVSWGAGAKAMTSISQVKYTKSGGTAGTISGSNITKSGTTVTVKIDSTAINGSNFILVFANASGSTFELSVDLVELAQNTGKPSVTVTNKASASGETAHMMVNWGSMTSVKKMTYTKPTGASADITSSVYLKTKGDVVSLLFTSTTIKGTDFILVLQNDSGATCELPVDLIG